MDLSEVAKSLFAREKFDFLNKRKLVTTQYAGCRKPCGAFFVMSRLVSLLKAHDSLENAHRGYQQTKEPSFCRNSLILPDEIFYGRL
jgi:hypothetical protein